MGYVLNKLANLPIENDVDWYIFIIRESFEDEYIKEVERNFNNVARAIGDNAIIVDGLEQRQWLDEVAPLYLGPRWETYQPSFPALLITDEHPSAIRTDTFRMLIPLATVPDRFGGWTQFFRAVTDFVLRRNVRLLEVYERTNNGVFAALSRIMISKLTTTGPEVEIDLGAIREIWQARAGERQRAREGPL